LDNSYRGFLFETFLINQIRAYNSYSDKNRDLSYYRVSGTNEIDLIIETKRKTLNVKPEVICLEFKISKKWDFKWAEPGHGFANQKSVKVTKKIGVYTGNEELLRDDFHVYPVRTFIKKLFLGEIF